MDIRLARSYILNQHVEAKHKPKTVKDREAREKKAFDRSKAADDLGVKGRTAFAAFVDKSHAAGAADKMVRL
jgi:hypothetical protein